MAGHRDLYIDFLRGVALLLLVAAHSSAPSLISTVRTFDVPLMVFISALCFRNPGNYGSYCLKRFRRICQPLFVFLIILFSISAFAPVVPRQLMTPKIIAGSFMMWNWPAIPFVWIMRVFLLMALVMPLLDAAVRKLSPLMLLAALTTLYILQNAACAAIDHESRDALTFFVRDYLLYLTGYSIIAVAGLMARDGKLRIRPALLFLCIAAIVVHLATGNGFDPQASKYPPASLYVAYGCACSIVLLMAKPLFAKVAGWSAWSYLSRNSMWIYLWHTIPVFVMRGFNLFETSWVARFVFILVCALALNSLWLLLRGVAPRRIAALME